MGADGDVFPDHDGEKPGDNGLRFTELFPMYLLDARELLVMAFTEGVRLQFTTNCTRMNASARKHTDARAHSRTHVHEHTQARTHSCTLQVLGYLPRYDDPVFARGEWQRRASTDRFARR